MSAIPTPRRPTRWPTSAPDSSSASGVWTLREFARVNNLADRNYVGSVIVGDTNGRFFEPAARRNYLIGVSANVRF